MRITSIISAILFLLTSCVEEQLESGDIVEGKPATIELTVNTPTRAGFEDDDKMANESKIENIWCFVFKDSKLVGKFHEEYYTPTGLPLIHFPVVSGSNNRLYVLANAPRTIYQRLWEVETELDLGLLSVTAAEMGNGLSGKALTMVGQKINIDVTPDNVVIEEVSLNFLAAKINLTVVDATPAEHSVTLLGWDIENAHTNSSIYGYTDGKENIDSDWLSTAAMMSFDKVETGTNGKKTAYLTQYIFENRRGGRIDHKPLPVDRYPGMSWTDENDKGKAWFAPKRATCIVIHAMHKTPTESKSVEARIFIGENNHSDYNIRRGAEYQFTVTVKGINDINIDTNLEAVNGNFVVHTSAPLDKMDAHPDFRPVMISGAEGTSSIEILDAQGRSYDNPSFDATWAKVSPLNLMYHQVRQAAPKDAWQQQAGDVGSFVRGKYIPHKSVRATLAGKGGWNAIPVGKEDDDMMTFADATYRMCYKITDIPFDAGAVTNKTLCVYADEFLSKGGTRSARIKITFRPNGTKPDGSIKDTEERILTITQNGYLTIYDETDPDAGLAVLNEDGTPSDVKKKFGVEQFEEVTMQMNPGIDRSVQKTNKMFWGFYGTLIHASKDENRNGYFLTTNAVYTDASHTTYRPKYGNGSAAGGGVEVIPEPYSGGNNGSPYYQPVATNVIYHPIYKSSAARYCHEKNRDMNGDGIIDASETKWYLPSQHELMMLFISNTLSSFKGNYWSVTEFHGGYSWNVVFADGSANGVPKNFTNYVRCIMEL